MLTITNLDARNAAAARRSAKPEPWRIGATRPLQAEELAPILVSRPQPEDPKAPLANLRDPHHTLARLIAKDKPDVEVSAITGYTVARIRTLKTDPAFQELVAHYAEAEVMAEADIEAQIKHVALSSIAVLQERMDSEPEAFSNKELREISRDLLDRIGHGPTAKIKHSLDPTPLVTQIYQTLADSGGKILAKSEIEAHFVEVNPDESAETSSRSAVR